MIVQDICRNPDRSLAKFDFARDGKETLDWLRFQWSWLKNKKARQAAEKLARKMAAWKKKKEQEKNDEKGRQAALCVLNKLARER